MCSTIFIFQLHNQTASCSPWECTEGAAAFERAAEAAQGSARARRLAAACLSVTPAETFPLCSPAGGGLVDPGLSCFPQGSSANVHSVVTIVSIIMSIIFLVIHGV